MTSKSQSGKPQSVPLVEVDILDRMNETSELIAQRAYEIYRPAEVRMASTRTIGSVRNEKSCPGLRSNAM
jgi:hypothetical protein